jgi:hypothetical protein
MKNTLMMLSCFMLAVSGTPAQAAPWQGQAKVKQIFIEGDASGSHVYVIFEGLTQPNPGGCGQAWGAARIHGDTEKGKYMLTLVHAAKLSGGLISVKLRGVGDNFPNLCDDIGRPIIDGIWLE